jgi:hypothetical protein
MCNPVVNFFFCEEDGEATRRQDAASGRGEIATRRDPLQGGNRLCLAGPEGPRI